MSLPTIASVVAQMSALVDSWNVYTTQLRNWLAGTATGGPGSDGNYPLTDDQGDTFLVPSPAAQAARVDAVVDSAEAYSTSAGSSAAAAATSAMNADTSEGKAATHRDDAQASATLAETYATAAGNSAASALASKTAAAASETAAATSASSMDQSVTDAQAAATSAEASAATATAQAALASSSATDAYASALTARDAATGALHYRPGGFDASAGVFPSDPTLGDFWKVTVAGTVDGTALAVGDQIIFADPGWDHIDNTESVTSVNGEVGAVEVTPAKIGAATATQGALADTLGTVVKTGTPSINPTWLQIGGVNGDMTQGFSYRIDTTHSQLYWTYNNETVLKCDRTGAITLYGTLSAKGAEFDGPVTTTGSILSGYDVAVTAAGSYARLVATGGYAYLQAGTDSSGGSSQGKLRITGVNAQDIDEFSVKMGGAYRTVLHTGNCARTFVQSSDPGSNASSGDLWIW